MEDLAYELNFASARLAARGLRRRDREDAGPAALRRSARSARPTAPPRSRPDVNDPGERNVTFDELVEAYLEQARGLVDGGADAAAHRDHLRHPQRQGRDLRGRDALRGAAAGAGRSSSPARSPTRPGAPCPVRSPRPSGTRSATRGRSPSGSTARSVQQRCVRMSRSWPASPTPSSPATPTPGCPTRSASTTRRAEQMAEVVGEFAPAGLVNLVGGCCGTTPDHIAAIAAACTEAAARAGAGRPAGDALWPASSRSPSPRRRCSSTSASGPTSPGRRSSAT